jgi:hypothetical protein
MPSMLRRLLTAAVAVAALPAATAVAQPLAPPRITVAVPPVVADPATGGAPEAEEARIAQLGLPRPTAFAPTSALRAAAEYLDAWHDRAWDRMALWAGAGAGRLERTRAADRLRGWALTGADVTGDFAVVEVLTARRGMRPVLRRVPTMLSLARAPQGRWRVLDVTALPERGSRA